MALAKVSFQKQSTDDPIELNIAKDILYYALQAPSRQIVTNAGLDPDDILKEHYLSGFDFGYNLKAKDYGNLIEMGVIDPTKVTRSALQNAVSVAVTILSTNAIITMARSYETE